VESGRHHAIVTTALINLIVVIGLIVGLATVILGLLPTPLMLYLAAAAGAAVTLWLWRGR
jgi:hypothetical protein